MYLSETAIIFLYEFAEISCHHKLSPFWHDGVINQCKDANDCQKQFYMTGKFVKNATPINQRSNTNENNGWFIC